MTDEATGRKSKLLERERILDALGRLSDALKARDVQGEVCLFGGTVMVLAFEARIATKNIDAVFQPTTAIRESAQSVAEELQLPADWLNDGVKGFLSGRHEVTTGNLPQFPNLRLTMPVPEYLLAMKCMAGRLIGPSGGVTDVPDIIFLITHLNIKTAEEVLAIVARYYPVGRISVKTQYLIEGLFQEGQV